MVQCPWDALTSVSPIVKRAIEQKCASETTSLTPPPFFCAEPYGTAEQRSAEVSKCSSAHPMRCTISVPLLLFLFFFFQYFPSCSISDGIAQYLNIFSSVYLFFRSTSGFSPPQLLGPPFSFSFFPPNTLNIHLECCIQTNFGTLLMFE